MAKKIIIPIIIVLLLVAGGVFWWWPDQAEAVVQGIGGAVRVGYQWAEETLGRGGQAVSRMVQNTWSNIQNVTQNTWDTVRKYNPFKAVVAPAPKLPEPEITEKTAEEELTGVESEIEQETGQDMPEPTIEQGQEPQPKMSLAEIQEMLDDIAERIDILSQKMEEIQGQRLAGQKDEAVEQEEAEEEVAEEFVEDEEDKEIIEQKEIVFCDIDMAGVSARNKVIFNEIAWMGTQVHHTNEWIELKNISGQSINLSGWQLLDKDQQIKIIFPKGANLLFNELFLLERTDDNSVPNVLADFIYTGGLSNTNEALYLFDANCQFQDKVIANPNWQAGDNTSKRTMERLPTIDWWGVTWQTSANPGGTPKKANSSGFVEIVRRDGGGAPPPPAEPTFCSQENLSSPVHLPVIINEIAWMGSLPKSGETARQAANNEWIELKNISGDEVNLAGWQLLDKDQQIKIIFTNQHRVLVNGFYLLEWRDDDTVPNIQANKTYTGNLRNSDESLRLFDQNCNLIDEVLADPNWPAGDKDERRSMERKQDLTSWQTYYGSGINGIMGTPKAENSQLPQPEKDPKDITPPEKEKETEIGSLSVVINEIAWMGSLPKLGETARQAANNEWIELYNNTNQEINLSGWQLISSDGSPNIIFREGTVILANSFFLLERTDDTTVSNIPADLIYTGALGNKGEKLELRNASGTLIDKVGCEKDQGGNCLKWFAGDNSTKQTMERKNSLLTSDVNNWKTSQNSGGTPKAKNSVELKEPGLR